MRQSCSLRSLIVFVMAGLWALGTATSQAWAATITLADKTSFTAEVVHAGEDVVVVSLARSQVASVNGQAAVDTQTPLRGARIALASGAALVADVGRVSADAVVVALPRKDVESVDGQSLEAFATQVGMSAPSFIAQDIQGRTHTVGGATGKVTLLHFWMSGSEKMRADIESVEKLSRTYAGNPAVQIITVSADPFPLLDSFVRQRQLTVPAMIIDPGAPNSAGTKVMQLYPYSTLPMTYLIDAKGIIRQKIEGSFTEAGVDITAILSRVIEPAESSQ